MALNQGDPRVLERVISENPAKAETPKKVTFLAKLGGAFFAISVFSEKETTKKGQKSGFQENVFSRPFPDACPFWCLRGFARVLAGYPIP